MEEKKKKMKEPPDIASSNPTALSQSSHSPSTQHLSYSVKAKDDRKAAGPAKRRTKQEEEEEEGEEERRKRERAREREKDRERRHAEKRRNVRSTRSSSSSSDSSSEKKRRKDPHTPVQGAPGKKGELGESAVRRKPGAGQKSQSPLLSDDEDTVAGKRSPLSFSSKKLLPPSPSSSSSDSAPKRKEEKKPKKASSSSDSSGDDSASGSSPAHPKRATKKSSSSTSESIEPKEKKRVNHKKPKTDARKRENEEVPLATNMAFNTIEEVQLINESLNKKRLKDFEKIKLLGRGSVGQVFLVRLKGTDQLYAMKVLEKEEMIKKNKVKRVLTEREVLATADHPFIVTFIVQEVNFIDSYKLNLINVLQKNKLNFMPLRCCLLWSICT
eukprot:TRINITY_DN13605_c0_g1_i2.p1 TRINITY_DN13605_c0_g1~~TRINITY_DN13605_c0_g1_i2.p1  ORF type:complete len:385 (+),score=84.99 TRINITY_DN13605_c0_g1_i2:92-1246(+)